ncbi:hypothetical protein ES707_21407 [subsurface metagenome]
MNDSPLRGKVARILDSRNLVINIGSQQGANIGMYFDVMDPKGEDIRDPDTNEILGSLERPKVRIRITDVQDKLSVASTYKKTTLNIGGKGTAISFGFAEALMPPKWVTKYETLKTDEKTWEDLSEEESRVKSGDPVLQVTPEVNESEEDDS